MADTLERLRSERADCVKKAQDITNSLGSKDGSDIPSAEQEKDFADSIKRVQEIDIEMKRLGDFAANRAWLEKIAGEAQPDPTDPNGPGTKDGDPFNRKEEPPTLGDFFVKSGGLAAVQEKVGQGGQMAGRWHVGVPSSYNLFKRGRHTAMKAATDAQSTFQDGGLTYPQYDTRVEMLPRLQPTIADLLGSGSLNSTALIYWIQIAKEGGPAAVAELGHKPFVHYTWDTRTDTIGKLAGLTKISDEAFQDIPYIVSEINGQLLYDLAMVEELELLNGDGAPGVDGLLGRSGVQLFNKLAPDSVADTIFKAVTQLTNTQYFMPDGIVIHPTRYQELRLAKDANGQYYGGGFFAPAYNNGDGLNWQPPIWGIKTVVTPAIGVDEVLVGAFKQAGTVYRKGGVSIDSTNSNVDDFEYNRVTLRVEERLLLQVKRPGAVVRVDLAP